MPLKLARLAVNWLSQPEMLRRYWDQAMTAIEQLAFTKPVLVSTLSSTPSFQRAIVSDSSSTVFYDIVTGGGSNTVPVFFDGTNWRIG